MKLFKCDTCHKEVEAYSVVVVSVTHGSGHSSSGEFCSLLCADRWMATQDHPDFRRRDGTLSSAA